MRQESLRDERGEDTADIAAYKTRNAFIRACNDDASVVFSEQHAEKPGDRIADKGHPQKYGDVKASVLIGRHSRNKRDEVARIQ